MSRIKIDELYYNLNDKTASVINNFKDQNSSDTYPELKNKDIIIPEIVEYEGKTYNVTSISDYAFNKTEIKNIVIPKSVTMIGSNSFIDNKILKSIRYINL